MPLPTDRFLQIAKALADARRLAILERIAANDETACQHLCAQFPVSQPTMSHHLRLLVEVGVIEMRRDGLHAHYRLRAEVMREYVESLELRMRLTTTSSRRR